MNLKTKAEKLESGSEWKQDISTNKLLVGKF